MRSGPPRLGSGRRAALIGLTLVTLLAAGPALPTGAEDTEFVRFDVLDDIAFGIWLDSAEGVLMLTTEGELRQLRATPLGYTTIWSIGTGGAPLLARYDRTHERLAIATATNLTVWSTSAAVQTADLPQANAADLSWDPDGDLWVAPADAAIPIEYRGQFEHNGTVITGTRHLSRLTALPDGAIITIDLNQVIRRSLPNGTLEWQRASPVGEVVAARDGGNVSLLLVGPRGDVVILSPDLNTTLMATNLPGGCIPTATHLTAAGVAVGCHHRWVHLVDRHSGQTFSTQLTGQLRGALAPADGRLLLFVATSLSTDVMLIDVDRDADGVLDAQDAFPTDPSQWSDRDGDGWGDEPGGNVSDGCPDDPDQWLDRDGDGWCDRPVGLYDHLPDNPWQHADRDGDGAGDIPWLPGGDRWPDDATQWTDGDGDGYSDEPAGTDGDACPTRNGASRHDRRGCPDADADGWSDADAGWPAHPAGDADAFPRDATQHLDSDGDGFGDDFEGRTPDRCPFLVGTSRNLQWIDLDQSLHEGPYHGCADADADGWTDVGDHFPYDASEYRDGDEDGVGSRTDPDDADHTVWTVAQWCEVRASPTVCGTTAPRDVASQERTLGDVTLDAIPVALMAGAVTLAILVLVQLVNGGSPLAAAGSRRASGAVPPPQGHEDEAMDEDEALLARAEAEEVGRTGTIDPLDEIEDESDLLAAIGAGQPAEDE